MELFLAPAGPAEAEPGDEEPKPGPDAVVAAAGAGAKAAAATVADEMAAEALAEAEVAAAEAEARMAEPRRRRPSASEAVIVTPLGKHIPSRLYTLPVLWERLMRGPEGGGGGWGRIKAETAAFKTSNRWRKRGVAVLPARAGSAAAAASAVRRSMFALSLYPVAAHALSELLPPARRPLPLEDVRISDTSSELLPNGGCTGGSTTSELACAAVRLACIKLVEGLKVEGAFVQGLGMVLSEKGPIGSKACGEPHLLLSVAALMALQRAAAEARSQAAAELPPADKAPEAAVTAEAAEVASAGGL
ncbi:hypothetical protein GPECTOR_857g99 [Gonium pectorale]|uniref:Aldehyde oxidase/xanthine dehydrogenase second molybdopterin binding domain-containing protein n=1 Tax=Gonium pectorale TaxID=33097 RepID=A0A150FVL2_GONPE|nr:hypothetical protein GPECTOR_857g99 [Gonium pectorale]|eukprot:KXZ41070.1 hypothetical protein GPECTOR_857g99 [Gonium pectorale]